MTGFTLMSSLDAAILKKEIRDQLLKCLALLASLDEERIRYLGPYRNIGSMPGKENSRHTMKADGSDMCSLLAENYSRMSFDGCMTIGQAFDLWTEKIMNSSFHTRREGDYIKLYTTESEVELELGQIGFGNTQILPIILEIVMARKGDIVIIENPEVHLHPRWKADLMELFFYAAHMGVKVIIETQSVEMILRGRLLVKEHPEYKKLTSLYTFEKDGFTCTISKIEIEDTGRMEIWPEDFIDRVVFEDTWRLM